MVKRIILLIFYILNISCEVIHYDSYTGLPITEEEYQERVAANISFYCVINVNTCDPEEWRRVDGSCNNLNHPSRGTVHTPNSRILPHDFYKVREPRRSKDGSELPRARDLRTHLLADGIVPDKTFTHLPILYLTLLVGDVTSILDTANYVIERHCCSAAGRKDSVCVPHPVSDDDPVHKFSNVRCLNLTRPISFQTRGCIADYLPPERLVTATPMIDLSTIYGNFETDLNKKGRKFEGGLLKYELENGAVWPPSGHPKNNMCLLNEGQETRCHDTPINGFSSNAVIGTNFVLIWFWRHHNHIAEALAKVNPCWDDDRLFFTARDINIAVFSQILYYEIFKLLMGEENLTRDEVISSSPGFRDLYDEELLPQNYLEFSFALRWFHTMQAGSIKMYDEQGHYLKTFPTVNLTLRTGYLALDNNFAYLTQGAFRQACAKIDYVVDPLISEVGLGRLQHALDLTANDLLKNRYFGFPPYIKYKQHFLNKTYNCFADLLDDIDPERVEILQDLYKHVEDIDLLSGMWLERPMEGAYLPRTLYHLLKEQLLRMVKYDRHWYERNSRPHAFTLEQLLEIRKATISRLLCDVGDKVTQIQPAGLLKPGPGNEIRDCELLSKIDYEAWRDSSCTNCV